MSVGLTEAQRRAAIAGSVFLSVFVAQQRAVAASAAADRHQDAARGRVREAFVEGHLSAVAFSSSVVEAA
jgi:hypothetical protein